MDIEKRAKRPPRTEGEEPIGLSRFQAAVAPVMLVAGLIAYPSLPGRIPQHWNATGHIDRWAPKSFLSVFFPVLIVLGMMLLAWALPRIDPFKKSYARFRGAYYLIIDVIVGFMAFIYALTLYAAYNQAAPIDALVPLGVGLLFAAIGNQLSKVKRNFFMGIRTPWTLASEVVWTRTHRVGARAFVVCGVGAAMSAFLPAPANYVVFMTLVLAATIGTVAYSYILYRRLEKAGGLGEPLQ